MRFFIVCPKVFLAVFFVFAVLVLVQFLGGPFVWGARACVCVCVCVDGPTLVTKYHDSITDHSKHCCHSIVLLTTQNKRTGLDLRFGFVGPTFKGRFGFTKSL